MSLIYPFKLFEKKYCSNELFSRKEIISQFIQEECDVQPCDGDLTSYINIYGYESVRLFMLLHPFYNKVSLNEAEVFGCWKVMNRIWSLFNNIDNLDEVDCADLIVCADNALKNKKNHTYIAFLMKILKLLKHNVMNQDSKKMFLDSFKGVIPLMINEVK